MTYVKSKTTGDTASAAGTLTSNLESIAAKLCAPASALAPSSHTKNVPGHIANILQVILLHDKFDQNFDKWNLIAGDDRDVLVLTLKNGAQIDSSLVYTICMMYPFRIHGPLVIKNTMHVEFLHVNRLENVGVTANITPKNIEYALGTCLHERKRQRLLSATITNPIQNAPAKDNKGGVEKSIDASKQKADAREQNEHATGANHLNLDSIQRKLSAALQASNNSRVVVDQVNTGFDAAGSWITFQLSDCDKLNLDFFGSFQLAIDDLPLKVRNLAMLVSSVSKFFFLHVAVTDKLYSCYSRCRFGLPTFIPSVFGSTMQRNEESLPVGNLFLFFHRIFRRRFLPCAL